MWHILGKILVEGLVRYNRSRNVMRGGTIRVDHQTKRQVFRETVENYLKDSSGIEAGTASLAYILQIGANLRPELSDAHAADLDELLNALQFPGPDQEKMIWRNLRKLA